MYLKGHGVPALNGVDGTHKISTTGCSIAIEVRTSFSPKITTCVWVDKVPSLAVH